MAFQPGQSGNPGGRPKENAEVKALARQFCLEAIEKLAWIMRNGDNKEAKAAADSLLDRGIGKPAQVVIGDADADPIQIEGRVRLVRPTEERLELDYQGTKVVLERGPTEGEGK